MASINLIELPYLIFRLAPIIIVSFFILQSFLVWDLKGVLYICGLLLTCVSTLVVNNWLTMFIPINKINEEPGNSNETIQYERKSPMCRTITLGENGEYFSNIPLNLVIYSFTFFYLFIFILNLANPNSTVGILDTRSFSQKSINSALQQNIPVLIFFPFLIIVELGWINMNSCISSDPSVFAAYSLAAIILGGAGGVLWAILITSIGVPQLQYITSGNADHCSRPSRTMFRCKPKVK